LLGDADQSVARAYEAQSESFTLTLVDGDGILRYVHYGRPLDALDLLTRQAALLLTGTPSAEAPE